MTNRFLRPAKNCFIVVKDLIDSRPIIPTFLRLKLNLKNGCVRKS